MNAGAGTRVVCLDIDGTLCIDGRAYPGAVDAVGRLSNRYDLAFVTNTTSKSVDLITSELEELGFSISPGQVYNPSRVARDFLLSSHMASGILMVDPAAKSDYQWFKEVPPGSPDCKTVLVGIEGYDLTFADLATPLQALLSGASLFALQKNRFYVKEGRILLDIGPITAALEYASARRAGVFGKPSRELFGRVGADFGAQMSELTMVGDDIEFDVFGAMKLGLTGILVKTGKYDPVFAARFDEEPDLVANSIAEVPDLLFAS